MTGNVAPCRMATDRTATAGRGLFASYPRKSSACLLLAFALPASASDLISMTDAGIYGLSGQQEVQDPDTTSGKRDVGGSTVLIQRTTTICARLGTSFGVRFTLSQEAGIDALPVDVAIVHPPMTNYSGGLQSEDHMLSALQAGKAHYYGWTFADPAKLLSGRWHITVSHGGHVLADQPFELDFTCSKLVS